MVSSYVCELGSALRTVTFLYQRANKVLEGPVKKLVKSAKRDLDFNYFTKKEQNMTRFGLDTTKLV